VLDPHLRSCFREGCQVATADYPVAAVHLIVPFPAGGGADYWGRLVATRLAVELGQSVIVDNIPGAGGNKGTAAATAASRMATPSCWAP